MNYLYISIGLSILFSIAASVCGAISWHKKSEQEAAHYLLAGHVALLIVAFCVALPLGISYKAAIILALLLTLVAQTLQKLAKAPAVVVQAIDLIIILLYAVTFTSLHSPKAPTPWLLLLLSIGGICYWGLQPKLAELNGTVAFYTIALLFMTWQATEVLVSETALWSWLAFGSIVGFAVSKLLQMIHYSYHADRKHADRQYAERQHSDRHVDHMPINEHNSADRFAIRPQWLHRLRPSRALRLRLTRWAAKGQQRATQLIEWSKLPALANSSLASIPLFVLFCQWLLVLSIWGPQLGSIRISF